jgi:hypothetical protein
MRHSRRLKHDGPLTYATWLLIGCAVVLLTGFSLV